MDEPHLKLPRFNKIGIAERHNVSSALKTGLSGYLGGVPSTGYWINKLQDKWCQTFGCKYAVPCNSATSGLLAACMAIGIGPGDEVWITDYSMSATAACAKVLGARIVFIDIETIRYGLNTSLLRGRGPKCIIVTNLFGHPAYISAIRSWCDSNNVVMVEDNAQAPFAMENNKFTGTVGHIGVFSLNVHKHIQCGEGGVIVTDDHQLSLALMGAVNHGELAGLGAGLNLRMTEATASIACAQLGKAGPIIQSRIDLGEEITDMFKDIPWVITPKADVGCKHVYYQWAGRVINGRRNLFVGLLNLGGIPMECGYSKPLNLIFDVTQHCGVAETVDHLEMMTFWVCGYDPEKRHLIKMREIINRAAGELDDSRKIQRQV
jgi:perosamine synthetase